MFQTNIPNCFYIVNYNKLSEFIDLASGLGYEIYITDEYSSSTQIPLNLKGMKSKLPIDIYAALNIVFRDGIRVVS